MGVGRSLYSPDKSAGATKPQPTAAPRLSVAQTTPVGHSSEGVTVPSNDDLLAVRAAMIFAESTTDGTCTHGQAWSLKPGGVSKASGKPYNAFWAASHKTADGSYCRDKPSNQWVAAHTKPAAPALVPEDSLEELPF